MHLWKPDIVDRRPGALPLLLVFLFLPWTPESRAQTPQGILLPPEEDEQVQLVAGTDGGTDADWNCQVLVLARTGLTLILPTDEPGGTQRARSIRRLGQLLAEEIGHACPNPVLQAYVQIGEAVGVELDVFEGDPTHKPDAEHQLPNKGLLLSPGSVPRGEVYYFDAAMLQYRLDQLVQMTGNPVSPILVFPGDVMSSSAGGTHSMNIPGSGNDVAGTVRSGGDLNLSGQSNRFLDALYYAGELSIEGSGHQVQVAQQAPAQTPDVPARISQSYLVDALAQGSYFTSSISIQQSSLTSTLKTADGTPLGSLIYCEGEVTLDLTMINASLTIVAVGDIDLVGMQGSLCGAEDQLLAWSLEGNVTVSAGNSTLTGSIFAPQGNVKLSGSNDVLVGELVARRVKLVGNGNQIDDGTR